MPKLHSNLKNTELSHIPAFSNQSAEVHPVHGIFFSEESYTECKWSLKALQSTVGKTQFLLNPFGDQAPLSVCLCLRWVCLGGGGWGWVGGGRERGKTPCSDYVEGICYVPFLPPPSFVLFLCVPLFVPFSSSPSSAFVWERILECSFDRINLSLALEFWLAEGLREEKKTLIKEIISSLEVWQLHFTSP